MQTFSMVKGIRVDDLDPLSEFRQGLGVLIIAGRASKEHHVG